MSLCLGKIYENVVIVDDIESIYKLLKAFGHYLNSYLSDLEIKEKYDNIINSIEHKSLPKKFFK